MNDATFTSNTFLASKPVSLNPEFVNVEHQARLKRLEYLAAFLDDALRIPGTKISLGWDGVIGLIPGVGDVLTATVAGYIIHQSHKIGVPKHKIARMVWNTSLDTCAGVIPLVGDVLDIAFKSNRKNLKILHEHLAKTANGGAKQA